MWNMNRYRSIILVLLELFVIQQQSQLYNCCHGAKEHHVEWSSRGSKSISGSSGSSSSASITTNTGTKTYYYYPSDTAPQHNNNNVINTHHGYNTKVNSVKEIVVGSFDIHYTVPSSAASVPNDTEVVESIFQTFSYVQTIFPSYYSEAQLLSHSAGYNYTYDTIDGYGLMTVNWINYDLTIEESNDILTPELIYDVLYEAINGNTSYVNYINELVDTPFEYVTDVTIDNYETGTPYPTTAPFPTVSPIYYPPTPSSAGVNVGDVLLTYTSPGLQEPSSDDFYAVLVATLNYFLDSIGNIYPNCGSTVASNSNFTYINPDADPNLLIRWEDYTFSCNDNNNNRTDDDDIIRSVDEIPSADEIRFLLRDSINVTYVLLIRDLDAQPFGDVTAAYVTITNFPTPSPTVGFMTDAPVPKSRRQPHNNNNNNGN